MLIMWVQPQTVSKSIILAIGVWSLNGGDFMKGRACGAEMLVACQRLRGGCFSEVRNVLQPVVIAVRGK